MLGNPIEATEASEAPVATLNPDRRKERREVRGRGRDIFWGQAIEYPRFGQGREVVLGGGASEGGCFGGTVFSLEVCIVLRLGDMWHWGQALVSSLWMLLEPRQWGQASQYQEQSGSVVAKF